MSTHGGDGIVLQQGILYTTTLSGTSAGAGVTRCDIKPSEGEVWDILYAEGYHDGAAAKTVAWYADDGTTELVFYTEANVAAATARNLYDPAYSGKYLAPGAIFRVNSVAHLSFAAVDVDAGAHVHVKIIALKWRGVEPWSQD